MLAALGVAAYFTRGLWMHRVFGPSAAGTSGATAAAPRWEPLTPAGTERTKTALGRLSRPSGQVFETLTAADIASYAMTALSQGGSDVVDSVQAGVFDDRVRVRAQVKSAALGRAVGPVAAMLREREAIELAGTLHVVRAGLGELTVREVKVRDIALPASAIGPVLGQLVRGARPEGISATGIAIPLPEYIGDIRVANGKVTLYKTVR
jgi:hypothetical protein